MSDNAVHNQETMSEETAQNAGARAAAVNSDSHISLEETRNAAAGETPTGAGSVAPSSVEGHVPSRSDPSPTNIPSTDHPNPDDADDEGTTGSSQSFSEESDDRYIH